MDNIYINHNDEQIGPFTEEKIRRYLDEGRIESSTLGWVEGAEWKPIGEMLGLSVAPPVIPPPPVQSVPFTPPPSPQPVATPQPQIATQPEKRKMNGCLIALMVIGGIAVLSIGGCLMLGGLFVKGVGDAVAEGEVDTQAKIESLESASVSDLQPGGELAKKFGMMSDFTDIQRENAENEITGKIVEWTLTVYEVSKSDDAYRIQTSGDDNEVGTFVTLYPRNDEERQRIEGLMTDNRITIRGYIDGTMMRNIEIDPAILIK